MTGCRVFPPTPKSIAWARAAHRAALDVTRDPQLRARWLRHGATWFVGVDCLPNAADGSVDGVPLRGPWEALIEPPQDWHKGQISVAYPGYPARDASESDAAHAFRVKRCAAHVDGLLLEEGRRYLREPHAFVLGIALTGSDAAPLTIWPESHLAMGPALRDAIGAADPSQVDLTEAYKAARASVFERIDPVQIPLKQGESVLLHRHLLHGVAPWGQGTAPPEGRMTAYFRPQFFNLRDWLALA